MSAPAPPPQWGYAAPPPANAVPQRSPSVATPQITRPLIVWLAVVGMVAIVLYSLEVIALNGQSATGPLVAVNVVLLLTALVFSLTTTVMMLVIANRTHATRWLAASVAVLVVSLCSFGFLCIVALVPAFFFGLAGPAAPVAGSPTPQPPQPTVGGPYAR